MQDKERKIVERMKEMAELKSSIENHLATIKCLSDKIVQHEQRQMQMQFKIDSLTVRAFPTVIVTVLVVKG